MSGCKHPISPWDSTFVWVLTAGGAAIVSVLLLHIPVASRLVGRAHSSLPDGALHTWFRNRSFAIHRCGRVYGKMTDHTQPENV